MANRKELALKRDMRNVTRELAELNRELANQMISLAAQTGETDSLIQAVAALRAARGYYSADTAPRENAEVQQALADTLLKLGREKGDMAALESAVDAYRGAITLASMLGDEMMRRDLKKNYARARSLLAGRGSGVERAARSRGAA